MTLVYDKKILSGIFYHRAEFMKIAIINTFDVVGGASRAAFRLHKGLRKIGVDATYIVKEKKSLHDDIVQVVPGYGDKEVQTFKRIQNDYINGNRTELSNTYFSFPYPGIDLSTMDLIQEADIINLHWIAQFQSAETINKLLALGKPVIWTLHDQWAFTGGCHYSAGCQGFKSDCNNCLQLKDDPCRLPYFVLLNKIKSFSYPNLYIVTPSKWLSGVAGQSIVFNNHQIYTIPYSIESEIFKPLDKSTAKSEFSISPDAIVLYFGSDNSRERRKGFHLLIDAIKYCLKNESFKSLVNQGKVIVLVAGYPNNEVSNLGIPVKALGFVDDDHKINLMYNAADVTLLPSLEDNLPNILLESMACGTPVIAFKTGGMPDMIKHGKTGLITTAFNTDEFGKNILKLALNPVLRKRMGKKCRRLIEKRFKLETQAQKYLSLFEKCLSHPVTTESDDAKSSDRGTAIISGYFDPNLKPLFEKYR